MEDSTERAVGSSGWIGRLRGSFRGGRTQRKVHSMEESAPPSSCSRAGIPAMESTLLDVPIDCTPQQFKILSGASISGTGHQNVSRGRSVPTCKSAISQCQSTKSHAIPGVERKLLKSLFHVPDNRLTLKLFGSKNEIKKEEERRKNCRHWVIHPCSKFR